MDETLLKIIQCKSRRKYETKDIIKKNESHCNLKCGRSGYLIFRWDTVTLIFKRKSLCLPPRLTMFWISFQSRLLLGRWRRRGWWRRWLSLISYHPVNWAVYCQSQTVVPPSKNQSICVDLLVFRKKKKKKKHLKTTSKSYSISICIKTKRKIQH